MQEATADRGSSKLSRELTDKRPIDSLKPEPELRSDEQESDQENVAPAPNNTAAVGAASARKSKRQLARNPTADSQNCPVATPLTERGSRRSSQVQRDSVAGAAPEPERAERPRVQPVKIDVAGRNKRSAHGVKMFAKFNYRMGLHSRVGGHPGAASPFDEADGTLMQSFLSLSTLARPLACHSNDDKTSRNVSKSPLRVL